MESQLAESKVEIVGIFGYAEPRAGEIDIDELPDISGIDLDKLNLDEYPQLKRMSAGFKSTVQVHVPGTVGSILLR